MGSSSTARWCTDTTSHIAPENFDKFKKGKPEYTCKELLKQVPSKYHLELKVFMKGEADILAKHWKEDHKIKFVDSK